MKKCGRYLFLLALGALAISSIACASLLEVIGLYIESEPPEGEELAYSLSLTQTAVAQEIIALEPTFTPEDRMVTITLVSENCTDQYFFADGVWVGFVAAYGTSAFEIEAGEYMLQACLEKERIHCGDAHLESFTESTEHRIFAHPSCDP